MPSNTLPLASDVACNGPKRMRGYKMVDCRDWTNIQGEGTGYPPFIVPFPGRTATWAVGNVLANATFGTGTGHFWAPLPEGATSLGIETTRNRSLTATCVGPCNGNHVMQTVYRDPATLPNNALVSFGGRFWSSGTGSVTVKVFQGSPTGALLGTAEATVNVSANPHGWVANSFRVDPGANHIKFVVYFHTSGKLYMDDMWMTMWGL